MATVLHEDVVSGKDERSSTLRSATTPFAYTWAPPSRSTVLDGHEVVATRTVPTGGSGAETTAVAEITLVAAIVPAGPLGRAGRARCSGLAPRTDRSGWPWGALGAAGPCRSRGGARHGGQRDGPDPHPGEGDGSGAEHAGESYAVARPRGTPWLPGRAAIARHLWSVPLDLCHDAPLSWPPEHDDQMSIALSYLSRGRVAQTEADRRGAPRAAPTRGPHASGLSVALTTRGGCVLPGRQARPVSPGRLRVCP